MEYNFLVRACHVPGVSNEIAFAFSCFQMQHFWALAPHLNQIPCTIPPSLKTFCERKCSPTLLGVFPRTQIEPTAVRKTLFTILPDESLLGPELPPRGLSR